MITERIYQFLVYPNMCVLQGGCDHASEVLYHKQNAITSNMEHKTAQKNNTHFGIQVCSEYHVVLCLSACTWSIFLQYPPYDPKPFKNNYAIIVSASTTTLSSLFQAPIFIYSCVNSLPRTSNLNIPFLAWNYYLIFLSWKQMSCLYFISMLIIVYISIRYLTTS